MSNFLALAAITETLRTILDQAAKAAVTGASATVGRPAAQQSPQTPETTTAGINIFVSTNVPISGTDAYAALFSPAALVYDQRRAVRLERERDASRRAWELNLSVVYGQGTWRPKFGVQGIFDNTAPS